MTRVSIDSVLADVATGESLAAQKKPREAWDAWQRAMHNLQANEQLESVEGRDLLRRMLRLADANDLREQVLESAAQWLAVESRVSGDRSREMADALWDVGLALERLGELESAEGMLGKCLALRIEHEGQTHAAVGRAAFACARIMRLREQYTTAYPVASHAAAVLRSVYGDDHVETLRAMELLGEVSIRTGRTAEGEALLTHVRLNMARRVASPNGMPALDANAMLQATVRELEETHRAHSREGFDAYRMLGMWYASRKQHEPARTTLQRALEIGCDVLGRTHPDLLDVLLIRVRMHQPNESHTERLRNAQWLLDAREHNLPAQSPSILEARVLLAEACVAAGCMVRANQTLLPAQSFTSNELQRTPWLHAVMLQLVVSNTLGEYARAYEIATNVRVKQLLEMADVRTQMMLLAMQFAASRRVGNATAAWAIHEEMQARVARLSDGDLVRANLGWSAWLLAVRQGDTERAQELLADALASHQDALVAPHVMNSLRDRWRTRGEALCAFAPAVMQLRAELADACLRAGHLAEAEEHFSAVTLLAQSIANEPIQPRLEALEGLAVVYRRKEQTDAAERIEREIAALHTTLAAGPDALPMQERAREHLQRAQALLRDGETARAKDCVCDAIALIGSCCAREDPAMHEALAVWSECLNESALTQEQLWTSWQEHSTRAERRTVSVLDVVDHTRSVAGSGEGEGHDSRSVSNERPG